MAYTKTVWENSPSTNTPINATNLNNMEDGIEANDLGITQLDNITKYITATAVTNGDYKINITNTLATNMVVYIYFPAATTNTQNARLSIDDGTNYKNIFNQIGQLIASRIELKYLRLRYDGTQWRLIDEDKVFKGCLLRKSSDQSINNASGTNLSWDTEVSDTDGFHDNSTNNSRITIPSGVSKVKLNCNVLFAANATGNRYAFIQKNGGNWYGMPSYSSNGVSSAAGAIGNHLNISSARVSVTAGDYFEARVYQDSGGALNVTASEFTTFSLEVIE